MSKVTPGFIFLPTPEVLLLYYLLPKVTNKPLPSPNPVKEKDLYKYCPGKIWDEHKEGQSFGNSDIFCFTKLRYSKERINRNVDAGGKWSQENSEEVRSSDTNKIIGNKRRFSYQNDTNKSTRNKRRFSNQNGEPDQHGGWVMYEYRLDDSILPASSGDNNRSYVLCQLRKNNTNSRKRKAQPQFQDFHSKAAFPSSSNLNQPISQASNSGTEPGEIEISGAQSYQPQPQLQDSPTDVVFPSSGAQFFHTQLQVQDSLTNGVFPSSFNLASFWTTNSGLEQGEIEISETQFQPQLQLQDSPTNVVFPSSEAQFFHPQLQVQDSLTNGVFPSSFSLASFWTTNSGLEQGEIEISETQFQSLLQLQDPPTNSVVPSNSNSYQPILSTTDSEYEQRETEISVAPSQPQPQLQNTVIPSFFTPYPLFLSTTNSEHEQGEIERSRTWFQPQPQDPFPIESYGAQSQPQPLSNTISTRVSAGRLV